MIGNLQLFLGARYACQKYVCSKSPGKGSSNKQSNRNSGLLWVNVDLFCPILGGFSIFGAERTDLPLFLLHQRTAFFEAHFLRPSKKWQVCSLKSYKFLLEIPLYHSPGIPHQKNKQKNSNIYKKLLLSCQKLPAKADDQTQELGGENEKDNNG